MCFEFLCVFIFGYMSKYAFQSQGQRLTFNIKLLEVGLKSGIKHFNVVKSQETI